MLTALSAGGRNWSANDWVKTAPTISRPLGYVSIKAFAIVLIKSASARVRAATGRIERRPIPFRPAARGRWGWRDTTEHVDRDLAFTCRAQAAPSQYVKWRTAIKCYGCENESMRPVGFGEAVPAGTRLTLFAQDKPDRLFMVIAFLIDKISGVALDLDTGVPCYQVEDEEGRIHLLLHLPIDEENENRWCLWRPDQAGFDSRSIFDCALVEE